MYITMGTAVYGYISYEFLGLLEVWARKWTRKWTRNSLLEFREYIPQLVFGGSILKWVILEF